MIEALESAVPDDSVVTLALRGPRGRDVLHLSAAQLEGFVVLGRYDRCHVRGEVFSDGVSRMHLGLMRCEGGIEVFDLASTNGVYVGQRRVRFARVTEHESFSLGEDADDRVHVRVRAPHDAAR